MPWKIHAKEFRLTSWIIKVRIYDLAGIGYNTSKKQKLHKNIFVKASYSTAQKIPCTFCNTKGHTVHSCYINKCVIKGLKTIWVPKKIATNL